MSDPIEEKVDQPRYSQDSFSTDGADATRHLLSEKGDVEAQSVEEEEQQLVAPPTTGLEYTISTRTKLLHLAAYFMLNLVLTIYNKAVFGEFAFPWILTALHTGCVSIGCTLLLLRGHFRLSRLSSSENLILVAFSFLFTINIAISNVSLAMVSVPFHQIMRSTCPAFAILIYRVYFGRQYPTATYLSLIPVILGVCLSTYGDYYFTMTGFCLTVLGVLLAALKTVVSNRLMTGSLALPAMEILLRMSPLAAVQSVMYAVATGESQRFLAFVQQGRLTPGMMVVLAGNGLLAFLLNMSSFQTNKIAGALTLTVAGNLKQTLTILLGIVLFNVKVGPCNGVGMAIVVAGAAWYSKVELDSKGKR